MPALVLQSKLQDGTVEPELLPVSELPQALSQMPTALLGGAPASDEVPTNSTRIGLGEVRCPSVVLRNRSADSLHPESKLTCKLCR